VSEKAFKTVAAVSRVLAGVLGGATVAELAKQGRWRLAAAALVACAAAFAAGMISGAEVQR
jgi:surface antigen